LPGAQRIVAVRLAGRRYRRFDPASATIDLSGLRGAIERSVAVERS
jgi:hypothetical protein